MNDIIAQKDLMYYGYRLVEGYEGDQIKMEGVKLSKNWCPQLDRVVALDKYIKTKINPDGILEYQEYYPVTGEIVFSSIENFEAELEIFSRDVLTTFKRAELIKLARMWGLDTKNKRENFLVKLIIEAQQKYKDNNFSMYGIMKKAEQTNSVSGENDEKEINEEGEGSSDSEAIETGGGTSRKM